MKLISKLTLIGALTFTIPGVVATHAIAEDDNNVGASSVADDSKEEGKDVIRGARGGTGEEAEDTKESEEAEEVEDTEESEEAEEVEDTEECENSSKDSSTQLDATEAAHLTFMREEEKLARDVYLTLAELYPEQRVFANIATKSEQTHTDTMRDKLELYNLDDPNPDTNNLPESLGVFTGGEWGEYFKEKFDLLTGDEWGAKSELRALYAGAFIEELDMNDIAVCPDVMVKGGGASGTKYESPCGLNYTDEIGLINAFSFLIDGSESHLRAYVGQIEAVIGECNYEAQYLSQQEVDDILGRSCDE